MEAVSPACRMSTSRVYTLYADGIFIHTCRSQTSSNPASSLVVCSVRQGALYVPSHASSTISYHIHLENPSCDRLNTIVELFLRRYDVSSMTL